MFLTNICQSLTSTGRIIFICATFEGYLHAQTFSNLDGIYIFDLAISEPSIFPQLFLGGFTRMLTFVVMLQVYFGLSFSLLTDGLIVSSNTPCYNEEFIVDFMMVCCPGLDAAKQLQFPTTPRFTIGIGFF